MTPVHPGYPWRDRVECLTAVDQSDPVTRRTPWVSTANRVFSPIKTLPQQFLTPPVHGQASPPSEFPELSINTPDTLDTMENVDKHGDFSVQGISGEMGAYPVHPGLPCQPPPRPRYGHPRLGPITEAELAAARADLAAQTKAAT
jgi:hypothetical protein